MPSTLGIVSSGYYSAGGGASSISAVSYAYSEPASSTPGNYTFTIDPTSLVAASGGFPSGKPNGQDRICLLVICDAGNKHNSPLGAPSGTGWTYESAKSFVASSWNFDFYTRQCAGSGGTPTSDSAYTVSSGGNGWGFVVAWAYRGASAGIQAVSQPGSCTNSALTLPALTTVNTNELILCLGVVFGSGITGGAQSFGTTDRLNNSLSGYTNYSVHYTQATAGSTGTKTVTYTGSSLINLCDLQIAIA